MRTVVAPGPMSMIHAAPEAVADRICSGQSTGVVRTAAASECASEASMPHCSAHSSTSSKAFASIGEWKGTYTGRYSHTGDRGRPPRSCASWAALSFAAARSMAATSEARSAGAPETTCVSVSLRSAIDSGWEVEGRDSRMRARRESDTPRTDTM